ncbi:TetR/AcrR family transcriptional regulator [Agrobacterium larrymoorei]|uniref:TetR/AcrR family transcriptional regulator n=1 Tax=Agrobacterium larrymoorei TaxID=160699 RepID=A0AAF0H7X8_9HYPH|nr:TetR/AcrR family transcriptional regulator [Agrobacterium larrymoorei]WHA40757.1 TetR/AcrR family transcriptional regulator [Agrobacterium larrymoorei]
MGSTLGNADALNPRRMPQQERSVQRVHVILSTAAKLIRDGGVAKLKITEVAKEAGIPIGSVYQYFPDKTAIVKALFEKAVMNVNTKILETLGQVQSLDEALDAVFDIIEWYHRELLHSPEDIAVWFGTETDLDLLRINIEAARIMGEQFAAATRKFLPEGFEADMEARTFLLSYLTGGAVKLAVVSDRDMAQRLLKEWRFVIKQTVFRPG